MPALATLDRATDEPVRRYERAQPGEFVRIDVKKLCRIPDGCGHKVLGRAAGRAHQDRRNGTGYAHLHTALDDHSRWTRPWRPRTNGKVERFLRTLLRRVGRHT